MSYSKVVWYRVRVKDGSEDVHRFAAFGPRLTLQGWLTLEQYHEHEGMTLIAGPFKTRKEAQG
jgi:hypothetical protein